MSHSARRRIFLAEMARFTAAFPLVNWSRDMAQQRVPRIGFMSGAEPSLIAGGVMDPFGHVWGLATVLGGE